MGSIFYKVKTKIPDLQIRLFLNYLLQNMSIRKIIKETIENLVNNQEIANKFDEDIKYLSDFELINKRDDKMSSVWVFEHKSKNYILRFFVEKDKRSNTWSAKVFVYWKKISKNLSHAKGKEYEHYFGPFKSYTEMVKELNTKLMNNPNISVKNFSDDNRSQMNSDLIYMIKVLQKKQKELSVLKDKGFDELKKLYNKINSLNTDEKILEFINKNAYDVEEKQAMLLILQNIDRIDFFIKKEELDSIF